MLTVATFNLRHGFGRDGRNAWPLRRRATAAMVRALGADVLGLQEARGFQLRYLLRATGEHRAYGEGRDGGRRGEATPILVAKEGFGVVSAATRWYGGIVGGRLPGASNPRIATIVRLRGESDFVVVNTHLDEHLLGNRHAAATELASWVSGELPTVVLGDLNTTEGDAGVFDALGAVGLRPARPVPELGTGHEFTGRTDGRRIDHVLVSTHFRVRQAEVVTTECPPWPSDHWPVRVVLEFR